MPVAPPRVFPAAHPDKRRYVQEIFSDIAPRYDLLNRVLSMNIDRSWRRKAVARLGWGTSPEGLYLDACAGTLDLSATLAAQPGFRGQVLATDFALPMLRQGADKTRHRGVGAPGHRSIVLPAAADTLVLPFAASAFDGAMVGFGVRNLADLDAGLVELARVLKPGARLVVLDFATPRFAPLRGLYLFYFRRVLPWVGRTISGHPTAYQYLPDSVMNFPAPHELERRLEQAGFGDCGHELLTGGIAAVTWGTR
jgi:demethylmenaquinone methyltransferase/2-methoxy-6-polyprenyl-1,4-benzoquinol methylase